MKNARKKNTLLKSNFDFGRFGISRPLMLGALSVAFFSNSMPIWAEQSNDDLLSVASVNQEKTVTGTVLDENGEPLIGVTVLVKGTTSGTVTDFDGKFSLSVLQGAQLEISYIGYKSQLVTVGNQKNLVVRMASDAELLDEVVVVGYGTMKKSDLTGSVASVSSEKIASRGTTSLQDALQGMVPGVNITQSDSRPGGSFSMQIRGQSSINKQANPLYVIDGIVCSSMDFLNPEDIERVDVLKDASSTAIYGSRASAGVILITTKGGKGGASAQKPVISYDGYYGVRKVARMPELMDAQEFIDYRFARYTTLDGVDYGTNYAGVDANGVPHYRITDSDIQSAFLMREGGTSYRDSKIYELMMTPGFEGFDWVDAVTRDAIQQNHYVSAQGATDKVNYRLGVGYQGDENVFLLNDYTRYNFKGAFDAKLSKVFEAGLSVNMAYTIEDDFCTDSGISPYSNAFYFNPYVTPYDENGNYWAQPGASAAFGSSAQFTSQTSPMLDLADENYADQTRKFQMLGNFYLRANIIDGLKFTTTFSPNFYYGRRGIFNSTGVTDDNPLGSTYYQNNKTNYGKITNSNRLDWTWDNQIDFNKTFGDHTFGAMGLFSMFKSEYEESSLEGKEISDDLLTYNALNKAAKDKNISSSYSASSLVSTALRLNYSYKGKYMATVTARADGSSRFAEGNRWGWFPSAALAWRISEEDFLKKYDWLDNLKLRLSYGVTGNNNVGDYVTMSTAAGPNYVTLLGSEYLGYYPNGLVNTGLIWEKVKEFDFGFDLSVLNNRVNIVADYYNRISDGQIMDRRVPIETGENSSTFNIGSVRNRGIEFALQLGVIRTKDFSWDLSMNVSRNWNEILELSNGKTDQVADNLFIGQPLNVLRDYTHTDVITDKGVTMHTIDGDIHYTLQELFDRYGDKYKWYEGQVAVNDWNNDGKINDDDKQIYGCTDPKWIGSLTSTMYYKGFDFSFMIYTKQGQWSYSKFHDGKYMKWSDRGNQHMAMDFYIPKGTPVIDHETGDIVITTETHYGEYPYPNNSDTSAGGYFSDKGSAKGEGYQYHETSFVKVKNITLGYTFPKNWISRIHLNHLRLYFNVSNPFCFTDYVGFDPEWASASLIDGGPASVTYQVGVNLKF